MLFFAWMGEIPHPHCGVGCRIRFRHARCIGTRHVRLAFYGCELPLPVSHYMAARCHCRMGGSRRTLHRRRVSHYMAARCHCRLGRWPGSSRWSSFVSHYMAARCHCRGYPISPLATQGFFALCERFFFRPSLACWPGSFRAHSNLHLIESLIVFAIASECQVLRVTGPLATTSQRLPFEMIQIP